MGDWLNQEYKGALSVIELGREQVAEVMVDSSERERKVLKYIIRRNASPAEVEDIVENPRLVEFTRKKMGRIFPPKSSTYVAVPEDEKQGAGLKARR